MDLDRLKENFFNILGLGVIPIAIIYFTYIRNSSAVTAKTAKEFVTKYSRAYQRGDIDTIMEMQYGLSFQHTDNEQLRTEVESYNRAEMRQDLERGKATRDLFWTAWEKTKYNSERQHGDHIHVEVSIDGGGYSEIVLMKKGEELKIHPRPSDVE